MIITILLRGAPSQMLAVVIDMHKTSFKLYLKYERLICIDNYNGEPKASDEAFLFRVYSSLIIHELDN